MQPAFPGHPAVDGLYCALHLAPSAVCRDVLDEAQFAAGVEHTPQLCEGAREVRDAAEDEGDDGAVEGRILERKRFGGRIAEVDAAAYICGESGKLRLEVPTHVWVGFGE